MKNREELWANFVAIAVKLLSVKQELVVPEALFKEDLNADSLDLVEFVMALEEEFDVNIEETELEGVDTIGQAFELVLLKLDEKDVVANSEAEDDSGND